MKINFMPKFLAVWERLSPREKLLAKVTAAAIIIMLGYTTYQRAMARLDDLDLAIGQLEDTLVSYTYQIAHRELVESRYAEIASQHSSAWTEPEIHDRLRQEIYRLASRNPAPLDENGIPVNTPNTEGNLVDGISLGKGNMAEGGKGYREYRINVRIPPCPLENLIEFLKRLQLSPQSLRIDAVELTRAPDGNVVSGSVDITRIVADGPANKTPAEQSPEEGTAAAATGRIRLSSADWESKGASVQDAPAENASGAVEIRAAEAAAEAGMTRELPGGTVYEMIIDLAAAQGDASVGVALDSGTEPFPGEAKVNNDGRLYRLQVQFTLPGDPATAVRVKCPFIRIQGKDTVVNVSNVLIRKVAEV